MGFDDHEGKLVDEISEMNSPKNADYFTWAYLDNIATVTKLESVKVENGVISFSYEIKGQIYGGYQTETRPGLGIAVDFSKYKMITAKLTNPSSL